VLTRCTKCSKFKIHPFLLTQCFDVLIMIPKLNSDYAPQHHQPMNVLLRSHSLVNFTAGLKLRHGLVQRLEFKLDYKLSSKSLCLHSSHRGSFWHILCFLAWNTTWIQLNDASVPVGTVRVRRCVVQYRRGSVQTWFSTDVVQYRCTFCTVRWSIFMKFILKIIPLGVTNKQTN